MTWNPGRTNQHRRLDSNQFTGLIIIQGHHKQAARGAGIGARPSMILTGWGNRNGYQTPTAVQGNLWQTRDLSLYIERINPKGTGEVSGVRPWSNTLAFTELELDEKASDQLARDQTSLSEGGVIQILTRRMYNQSC